MPVEYLDPRAEPGIPCEPYALRLDVGRADLSVGLLANGFADSVSFLEEVGSALRAVLPGVRIVAFAKPNPSIVADDQVLDAISAECHAVVTAYGH